MLLTLASAFLFGLVGYSVIYPGSLPGSLTNALNEKINNGYRFRDVTYTNQIDLMHPDVRNNGFYHQGSFAVDRGDNGVPRQYTQLHPGSSEITQFTLAQHLYV